MEDVSGHVGSGPLSHMVYSGGMVSFPVSVRRLKISMKYSEGYHLNVSIYDKGNSIYFKAFCIVIMLFLAQVTTSTSLSGRDITFNQ